MKERTRERAPLDWAATQSNLGFTFLTLGAREHGTEELKQAVSAFQEALKERTRQRAPLDWGITEINLGNAFWALALITHETGTESLLQAASEFRKVLKERTPQGPPTFRELAANLHDQAAKDLKLIEQEIEKRKYAPAAKGPPETVARSQTPPAT